MILAPKYSNNKNKKGKKIMLRQLWILSKIQLFQLHQMIFRNGQDSPACGHFSIVSVVTQVWNYISYSSYLLISFTFHLI